MVPEPTTAGAGPFERALRAVHLTPSVQDLGETVEVRARVRDDTYFGYGDTREAAMRDLVRDLPEPLERRVSKALIA